jgi:hypothetical protein
MTQVCLLMTVSVPPPTAKRLKQRDRICQLRGLRIETRKGGLQIRLLRGKEERHADLSLIDLFTH